MGSESPSPSSTTASTTSLSAPSSSPQKPTPTFYPAYCNPASPTWNTWVKLCAYDIHHVLKPRAGYTTSTGITHSNPQTQGLTLFYLNHPVYLIQIIGVVVALDEYNERLWLFTVDDGSGETIEVVCAKPPPKSAKVEEQEERKRRKDEIDEDEIPRQTALAGLEIGTVVQAKGSISSFRDVRQLNLKRLVIVHDTTAEILLIEARTRTLVDILSKPWILNPERQRQLLKEAQGEVEGDRKRKEYMRERQKRRAEREERHAKRIAREYEAEEREREKAGEEARRVGLQLQKAEAKVGAKVGAKAKK